MSKSESSAVKTQDPPALTSPGSLTSPIRFHSPGPELNDMANMGEPAMNLRDSAHSQRQLVILKTGLRGSRLLVLEP